MLSLIWGLDSGPQDYLGSMNSGHIGALRPDQSGETEPQTARPPRRAACPGVTGCSPGPEPAWSASLRDSFRTLGRIVSPSRALWASAPRIVREYAAAGSRAGEIASSMPTLE